MLGTYELAMKITHFFAYVDPYGFESDMVKDSIDWAVDCLLHNQKQEIIDQIEEWELEPGDGDYEPQQEVLSAIRAYEIPWMYEPDEDDEPEPTPAPKEEAGRDVTAMISDKIADTKNDFSYGCMDVQYLRGVIDGLNWLKGILEEGRCEA